MKKLILLTMAAALTFLNFKCDEDGVVIDFNYTYANVEFSIEPVPVTGEQSFATSEIDLKIDSVFAENDISKESLKGAKITSMKFVITAPANGNFNAIDYLDVSMSAPSAGLPEVHIAKTPNPMPQDVQSVEVVADGGDLAPYIKAGVIKLIIKGKNNAPIEEKIDMKGSISFTISGEVL